MGLLGAIIGSGIGFVLGGPLGAIFGGALGSNLEGSDVRQRSRHPGARTYSPLEAQQAFLVAVISLAAKVAKADGRVTPEEVASFDRFLQQNLGMSGPERRVAARIFNEARDSDIPAEEFARQIRSILGHQRSQLRDLISLLLSVALADGKLTAPEEDLIRRIARAMGLDERDYQEARAMFQPKASLDDAYSVLGVASAAQDAEIKRAYRKLAKEYHPDVVASKGMGEDFQRFAAQKMRAVNDAYDKIKEARGL